MARIRPASAKKASAKKASAKKAKTSARATKVPATKTRSATKTRPAKEPTPATTRSATRAGDAAGLLRAYTDNLTAERLAALRAQLRGSARTTPPQSVLRRPDAYGEATHASWDRQLVDPALVELALELGVPLRIPVGAPETFTFGLTPWAKREVLEDALARVVAHPFFGRVLVASFLPTRETKDVAGNWLERAAALPAFAPVVAALATKISALVERWTVGALEVHGGWLETLCRPAIVRHAPAIAEAVRGIEAWRLLRNQLRAGILDEWGWPAQDEALARLGGPPDHDTSGPPPYLVYFNAEQKRVVAFGPDAVVLDEPYTPPVPDVRAWWYDDGDVLACTYPAQAQWVKAGSRFEADPYGFAHLAIGGALLTRDGVPLPRGATSVGRGRSRGSERYWFDGARVYGVSTETVIAQDLTTGERATAFTLDPRTGARGPAALPAWFASLLDAPTTRLLVDGQVPHLELVGAGAGASPLGAKDGVGGAALVIRAHEYVIEGTDGRRAPGLVNGQTTAGLMTFPERPGFYPIVQATSDLGIALPDGTTPLVPIDRVDHPAYWGGGPPVPLRQWYALRPRDPAASRALAQCSDEAARAILAAATATPATPDVVTSYGAMQVVLHAAPAPIDATGAQRAAIMRALPEVTHPKLVAGVAALAGAAADQLGTIARLKGHLGSALAADLPISTVQNEHAASLAALLDHRTHWWVEKQGIQLGQQMHDVSHYLFTATTGEPSTPSATVFPWERLLSRIGEVMYRALASATPKQHRAQLAGVLRLWRDTRFPANLAAVRAAVLAFPAGSELLAGMTHDHPDRLVAPGNRYFLRWRGPEAGAVRVLAIEATRDGVFRVPPGAQLVEELAIDRRFGDAPLDRAIGLARERGRVEYAPAFAELVARETGLGLAAATLVWAAAYDPWLIGDKARAPRHRSRRARRRGARAARYAAARAVRGRDAGGSRAAVHAGGRGRARARVEREVREDAPFLVTLASARRSERRDDALPRERDTGGR